jgi:hypothetical protein
MGATNYQMALTKRYSKLTGLVEDARKTIARIKADQKKLPQLETQITELQPQIQALAVLLKADDPAWRPERAPPIMPFKYGITPIPFGSVSRRGIKALFEANRPMTARELAVEVLRQAGTDDPPPEMVLRTTNTINSSLRKFEGRTVVSSGKYPAQWRPSHKPGIRFDP